MKIFVKNALIQQILVLLEENVSVKLINAHNAALKLQGFVIHV